MFYWELRRLGEGFSRSKFDYQKFQELTEGVDQLQLITDEDRERYRQIVDNDVREGRLDSSKREQMLRHIEEAELYVRRDYFRQQAAQEVQKQIKVPGELEAIKILLDPNTTPEQVRELCKEAFMTITLKVGSETREVDNYPAWPIAAGSTLPGYLSEHAEQYVAALKDPRFPRCDVSIRPSNRLKQLWFASRALAGAVYGVKTRTAINLVGSLKPEEAFEDSRNARPVRQRIRPRYKSRRAR